MQPPHNMRENVTPVDSVVGFGSVASVVPMRSSPCTGVGIHCACSCVGGYEREEGVGWRRTHIRPASSQTIERRPKATSAATGRPLHRAKVRARGAVLAVVLCGPVRNRLSTSRQLAPP